MQYIISSGVTEGGRGENCPLGKLILKIGLPLSLYFGFSIFWFSARCCFYVFFGLFSSDSGFYSLAIHIRIHHHFSSFFSECWLVDPVQWPVGPFYLSFPPWVKTLVNATDYSYVK